MGTLFLREDIHFFDAETGASYIGSGKYDVPDEKVDVYLGKDYWAESRDQPVTEDSDSEIDDAIGEALADATDGDGPNLGRFDPIEVESDNAPEGKDRASDVEVEDLDTEVVETMEVSTIKDDGNDVPDSVDLSDFLTANVNPLKREIHSGKFDDDLNELLDIEEATKDRKSLLGAIEKRKSNLATRDSGNNTRR